ncbi:hypothetical protein C1H46_008664 [Malus baccata]|uniref:Uncharacterized protein n=1 Tax=Malus baccata TaxID=106549 RepID=A0A540N3X4_MALBA|nr:hypothetical protein C1H46_008664 [Malus baccata]
MVFFKNQKNLKISQTIPNFGTALSQRTMKLQSLEKSSSNQAGSCIVDCVSWKSLKNWNQRKSSRDYGGGSRFYREGERELQRGYRWERQRVVRDEKE